jgi:hypothetical protein
VRKDKLDGRDVYVITGVRPDKIRERLYFDAETGLLLRRVSYLDTPVGVIPDEIDYEDYRDVDGVKVPFTVKIYTVGGVWSGTRKFTDVKLNAPLDATRFSKPATPSAQPKP